MKYNPRSNAELLQIIRDIAVDGAASSADLPAGVTKKLYLSRFDSWARACHLANVETSIERAERERAARLEAERLEREARKRERDLKRERARREREAAEVKRRLDLEVKQREREAREARRRERERERDQRARERIEAAKARAGTSKHDPRRAKRRAEALESIEVMVREGLLQVRKITSGDLERLTAERERRERAHKPGPGEVSVKDVARMAL